MPERSSPQSTRRPLARLRGLSAFVLVGLVVALHGVLAPSPAVAAEEEVAVAEPDELEPDRSEWAVLPALGGNTDVGFIFGALFIMARYLPGYDPYRWRQEGFAVATVKEGSEGVEFPVQHARTRWDIPGLAGGRLRLYPSLEFRRISNAGYFGLGNDSRADAAPAGTPGDRDRRHQYERMEANVRFDLRYTLSGGLSMAFGVRGSYVRPDAYDGSRLAEDMTLQKRDGSLGLYGTGELGLVEALAGLIWDTRDHETVPTRGMYHELSFRGGAGVPAERDVWWWGFSARLRFYFPLAGAYLVLAGRLLTDQLYGHPPFYEMARGGAFPPRRMPGGPEGIRGIPEGRYHNELLVMANLELRSLFWRFQLFGVRFRLGAAAFADIGRMWTTGAGKDGGPPLFGVGGGIRLQWGESVVVRVDVAWAPQALDARPPSPVGVYVELGEAF